MFGCVAGGSVNEAPATSLQAGRSSRRIQGLAQSSRPALASLPTTQWTKSWKHSTPFSQITKNIALARVRWPKSTFARKRFWLECLTIWDFNRTIAVSSLTVQIERAVLKVPYCGTPEHELAALN